MRHWRRIDSSQIAKCPNFMGSTKTKKGPIELAHPSPKCKGDISISQNFIAYILHGLLG